MQSKSLSWQIAWDYPAFRVKFLLGLFAMGAILFFFPDFFLFIQKRNGLTINDWLLDSLPAKDVSTYIFVLLYPITGFFFWRMIKKSSICITALWGYIFLCLVRMLTISLMPLEPPKELLHLSDPFSLFFYGPNLITKDLFFSGHTATLFLVALCLENKWEKGIAFGATVVLGVLLLIQHVHYTADILAAPIFSYLFWYIGRTIARI
jgi:hypothetical protein